jgi:hypothetical protein
VVELVGQVVVRAGRGRRQRAHGLPVEQVPSDVVERHSPGPARRGGEAVREIAQRLHLRVREGLVRHEQQLRRRLLGQHVDRHPEIDVPAADPDLEVRAISPALGPALHDAASQHPVTGQRHRGLLH